MTYKVSSVNTYDQREVSYNAISVCTFRNIMLYEEKNEISIKISINWLTKIQIMIW